MKTNDKPFIDRFDYYFFKIRDAILKFVFTVYYKTKRYFYNGNFVKKHLTFGVGGGKIQIVSTNHEDYIVAVQKKINKLSIKKKRREFIKLALTEALNGCNFIVFSISGDENKFIQFWTGEHQLKYNFYANDVNKLKNHFLSVVGLLSEMGFVNDTVPEYRGHMTFKIDKGTDYISVDANFKKDLELAVEFTEIIYKQIYKTKGSKLVAKVE